MDVDRLQRINALAGELKKRNFAMSSDDAYRQAEQVYDGTSNDSQAIIIEHAAPPQPKEDPLATRKIELMLEMATKKYEGELSAMRNAINMLAQEIELLKGEMRKSVVAEASAPRKEKQAEL